jgi:hypothetical protein
MPSSEKQSSAGAYVKIERPEPIVRADAMAYVMFERQDVAEMSRFLADFGFVPVNSTGEARYFRGYGTSPWLVSISPSSADRFVGFGVSVRDRAELKHLASVTGNRVETIGGPGGGERVRLTDPEGLVVDVVFGAIPLEPMPTRHKLTAINTPDVRGRVNTGVRTPLEAAPVFRLGHVVLQRPDFGRAAQWYMRHLGVIPSDIQVLANGQPALGFFRLDRGPEPADHHSLAILGGPATSMLHVSFETFDLESVGQGHQYLRGKGWTPYWGIGRHNLGSQIFDYWHDPVGDQWEHYADGDVFDADQPTGYHQLSRGTLWAWGDDLPDSMRPNLRLEDIPAIHAAGGFGSMDVAQVTELMKALLVKPRPWMS